MSILNMEIVEHVANVDSIYSKAVQNWLKKMELCLLQQ